MAVNAQMPASTNAQTIVRPDSMKEAAAPVAIRHKGAERKLRPRFRRQGQIPWRRKPRSKVGARVVRAPGPDWRAIAPIVWALQEGTLRRLTSA